jgi:hypothetical protein
VILAAAHVAFVHAQADEGANADAQEEEDENNQENQGEISIVEIIIIVVLGFYLPPIVVRTCAL